MKSNAIAKEKRRSFKGPGLTEKKNMLGYLYVLPFLVGLVAIFVPALVKSVFYSFSKVEIGFDAVKLTKVGWQNYTDAFNVDINFLPLLWFAIRGMLLDLVIITFFSFFVANVLSQKFVGRAVARTIFFLPVVVATGVIALTDVSSTMLSVYGSNTNNSATIASAFSNSGISSYFNLQNLLMSANLNATAVSTITNALNNTYSIVNSSGVQILIFLSALQSISPSIFEAAKVEGATPWEEFWKITFPMLTPMILVNVVYTLIDSFTNPKYQILYYIKNQAFALNKMGYASALSWIFFLVVLVIIGVIWKGISKRIQYLD